MRKISYHLLSLILILTVFSCEEINYKDMNIAQYKEEVNVKDLVGDLTSHIVVKTPDGADVTAVDMGATFYAIDNTEGGADSRTWTITQGSNTITSDKQLVKLSFARPGQVTLSLTSKRTSDGKEITSQTTVTINSIPVEASFLTNPVDEAGVINIFEGDEVTFTTEVKGSPTMFDWVFEGPETLTSSEQNPTVQFIQVGVYNVKFTASRDDGEAGISSDVVEKTAFINVQKRNVQLIRAIATDNKIELQYNFPVASNVADAASEFSISINTAAGATLTPPVMGLESKDASTLVLTFGDNMFSDDEVLLTFAPTGKLKDATGLVMPEAFENEPCVYGKTLAWGDMEDESKWAKSWNTANNDGKFLFVDENSPDLPMKPYQGHKCIVITRGSASTGVSLLQGYDVQEGDVFEFAYEALSVESVPGALERRMSTTAGDGSNAAGGNWMQAKQNGNGTGKWMTVRKTINVSAQTKGKTGTLYFHFLRYGGGSDTAAIWIDNLRIYFPNPRP